jgi:hypothetical protein
MSFIMCTRQRVKWSWSNQEEQYMQNAWERWVMNACTTLVGRPEGKAPFGIYRCRWEITIKMYCRAYMATIIDGVLDWQLDLLDHTQLQCIHFSIHCRSCNSSLKTAARPEYSLVTLSANSILEHLAAVLHGPRYIVWEQTTKKTPPNIPLLLEWHHYRNGPQRKRWSLPLLVCMATAVKKRLTVDCWRTACTSQYIREIECYEVGGIRLS